MEKKSCFLFEISILFLLFALVSIIPVKADTIPASGNSKRAVLFNAPTAALKIKLIADWPKIWADTGLYPSEHQGFLEYLEDSKPIKLSVKISLRGEFRLKGEHCSIKPLKLNFKKKEVANTIWEGQDKLKLVLQCSGNSNVYKTAIFNEFLAYRIFNQLSQASYNVKLLEINCDGFDGKSFVSQIAGFVIESDLELEERLSGKFIKVHNIHPNYVNLDQMLSIALFQYMIGNTDWSVKALHNIKLLGVVGGPPVPIPYDFDFSGLVNAPYAMPAPHLPITNVRERHYNGHCQPIENLQKQKILFTEKREAIFKELEILRSLDLKIYNSTKEYLESFYEILNAEDLSNTVFVKECRND